MPLYHYRGLTTSRACGMSICTSLYLFNGSNSQCRPAVWTMGNLGRAGYGASLDGTASAVILYLSLTKCIGTQWPYSYDACDVGTMPNQTLNGLPKAALVNGDGAHSGVLSYQGGQRLSRCTCSGESHPGPMRSDGSYVGRSAPEIDVFEAQVGFITLVALYCTDRAYVCVDNCE